MPPPSTLIFGCGYLGERVARRLVARGDQVYGTTRRSDRAAELTKIGIQPLIADVTDRQSLLRLPEVDRVLFCVGFDRRAGNSIRQVYVDGFAQVLDSLYSDTPKNCSLLYVSSTGVYGGNDGGWVDETTPAAPQTESGQACLDAEHLLANHPLRGDGSTGVLRMAGLYGPGRIMRQASLQRGEPVVGAPDKYLNFIQIDDAAAVTVRALDELASWDFDLWLVADGNPVTRTEFYGTAAELLHAPPPTFEPPESGSPAALREESNKRISNRKLIDRFGSILRYPDVRSGLAASIRADAHSEPPAS